MLVLKSLFAGIILGAIFSALKLPIPAPPTIIGIVGIVGIYLGFNLIKVVLG